MDVCSFNLKLNIVLICLPARPGSSLYGAGSERWRGLIGGMLLYTTTTYYYYSCTNLQAFPAAKKEKKVISVALVDN